MTRRVRSFLASNAGVVGAMKQLMQQHFDQHGHGGPRLDIQYGCDGSRLSHSHSEQYQFVMQTLALWQVPPHAHSGMCFMRRC